MANVNVCKRCGRDLAKWPDFWSAHSITIIDGTRCTPLVLCVRCRQGLRDYLDLDKD